MMTETTSKPKVKSKLSCIVVIAIIITSPVWLLLLGVLARIANDSTFIVREDAKYSRQFPFLKEDIAYVHIGTDAYYEGTASWADVKKHFNDFEWEEIDEERGEYVRCYMYSKIHKSQVQSAQNNAIGSFYDHKIFRGFSASKRGGKGDGRVRIEVFFDSDNNRFFYTFELMW